MIKGTFQFTLYHIAMLHGIFFKLVYLFITMLHELIFKLVDPFITIVHDIYKMYTSKIQIFLFHKFIHTFKHIFLSVQKSLSHETLCITFKSFKSFISYFEHLMYTSLDFNSEKEKNKFVMLRIKSK